MLFNKLVALILLIAPVTSYGLTGAGFVTLCNQEKLDAQYADVCNGYIQATLDLIRSANNLIENLEAQNSIKVQRFCVPDIDVNQAKSIAIKWYQDHPQNLHLLAVDEIRNSIYASFPCSK